MKILITGIHGFVGSNLVKSLKNNHVIFGLDIVSSPISGVVKIFNWNELMLLPEVDVIIHLTGKAHDTKNKSLAEEYFNVNTELTKNIYNWFLEINARKFIFFSTVKAVADVVKEEILTEDVEPMPVGPYGESKREAEIYILNQHADTRVKQTYILRPSMIHGEGNKGNLNLLFAFVKKSIPWPLGAFQNKRSFTSMENLIFILHNLIDNDIESGIYQVADDEAVSTRELISIISEVIQKPVRIWNINQSLINTLALIGTWLHLPLNQERVQKLTENYVVSNVKIKKAMGIQKMPVAAIDGLKKTIKSFMR
ncbi:MAG: NAD-dependent epimerase/dehydratase family protein [Paludibacter sp.]|nr:NAD-dependent epimerase/dehydratase family protein [Paludibacter sp.]